MFHEVKEELIKHDRAMCISMGRQRKETYKETRKQAFREKQRNKYSLELHIWRRQWHSTPVLLLENPTDGGAWEAAVHGVAKRWTQLNDFTFTFHFHALERGMAAHSSVLAWRIPGMGEPGGLPSIGSHRVGHD